ncbi:hypothetical protein [Saccharicrinis sp. FJH54]|uniref:hypothetical protein n=1 Tax=Saccharicrinis sp. FJH54 TaxID=3344665 RepID=UPI0035D4CA10
MNKGEFIAYLKEPASVKPEVVPQLKELLKAYPAFQTGHVLLLKSLYETRDVLYEKYLTKIAAYAGNRELLYDFILGSQDIVQAEPEFLPVEPISSEHKEQSESFTEQGSAGETDLPQESKEKSQKHTYFDSVTISNDYFNISEIAQNSSSEDKFDGVHSFAQWLDIMTRKQNEPEEENPVQPNKKWELIDNFIKENPGFVASREKAVDKEHVIQDLSSKSISDNDEFITETLARIYIKQRNFDKALHIFKKLSLKYPEKSIYFAGQIKIVEQLKNNEK